MKKNKETLLPCPFCSGPAVNVGFEFITCGAAWNRDCAGHKLKCSEEEWNTRSAPPPETAETITISREAFDAFVATLDNPPKPNVERLMQFPRGFASAPQPAEPVAGLRETVWEDIAPLICCGDQCDANNQGPDSEMSPQRYCELYGCESKEIRERAERVAQWINKRTLTATAGGQDVREALQAVLNDIAEYERVNNLAPNPGRKYCWDSVARAHAALASSHCPNGLEHGSCLYPKCISSCPGRLALARSQPDTGEPEISVLASIGGWRVGCENEVEQQKIVTRCIANSWVKERKHYAPASPEGDAAYELSPAGLAHLARHGTPEQFKDAVLMRDWYRENTRQPETVESK